MRSLPRKLTSSLVVLAALAALAPPVSAQDYPSRVVKIVVPAGAGGPTDLIGRLVAQNLGEILKSPFIVDNRAGAGGDIGADAVAKAKPDGYTLLVSHAGPLAYNKYLFGNQTFDAARDLTPVVLVADAPLLMMVGKDVPVNSLSEFIKLAKAKPHTLNVASAGNGTFPHLCFEMLKSQAGIDIVHVPYKSAPAAMQAVLAGEADAYFDTPSQLAQIKAGRIKALAVTSALRSPLLPEVPTMKESGLPDFVVTAWFGLYAPAGTDKPVIAKLVSASATMLGSADVKANLATMGFEPNGRASEQFSAFVGSEQAKWSKVVRDSGAKVQ
ncbi:MAG: tripartite tricarboxylate transporter substrate binding protein [Casimicrobiaceae bacterium]